MQLRTRIFATALAIVGVCSIGTKSVQAESILDWMWGTNKTTAYYGGVNAGAGACCTTTCPQKVCHKVNVNYKPQTCYKTAWFRVPVTVYRPVTSTDPCTGCTTTCMKPCQSFTWQARRVPYTTYRPVVTTTPIYGNSCSTCPTGRPAMGVPSYSAPAVGSTGCSTCGVTPGYASSGYAPQSYTQNYGTPSTSTLGTGTLGTGTLGTGTQGYNLQNYGGTGSIESGSVGTGIATIPQNPADAAPTLQEGEVGGTSILQKPAVQAPAPKAPVAPTVPSTPTVPVEPRLNGPQNEAAGIQPHGQIKPVLDLDAQQNTNEIRAPRLLNPHDRQAIRLIPSPGSSTPAIWKTARSAKYDVVPTAAISKPSPAPQAKPFAGGWRASK